MPALDAQANELQRPDVLVDEGDQSRFDAIEDCVEAFRTFSILRVKNISLIFLFFFSLGQEMANS